jgi:Reverse transcriptase (RNA-dependent DNA polymerase)
VRPTTIRLVLSITVTSDWSIKQFDVQNAFLHDDLQEMVYMHQSPGFVNPTALDHVCLLSNALYGLKQSPHAWFQTLHSFLHSLGFHASKLDPSLFVLHKSLHKVIILVYVDIIIITCTTPSLLTTIIHQLNHIFAIKDLDTLHYFLGIEVTPFSTGLHLFQHKYVKDLLHRAKMSDSKPSISPIKQTII